MDTFRREFLTFAIETGVIRFGQFVTKAGRTSPYFFNAGLFSDGASLHRLCQFYADAVIAADLKPDVIFGPAYKGIVLAAGLAMALSERGMNLPFCYNRKEAKDHGEGGVLVGAQLKGRVLIIDDVISAGTSIRESVSLIQAAGATPYAVITALDRMERGTGPLSATQEVQQNFGLEVTSIANLDHLLSLLEEDPELKQHRDAVRAYRTQFGISS